MSYSENEIIYQLNQGDQKILKHLFNVYFRDLMFYSLKFVMKDEIAEEIVQDVFIQIWKKKDDLQIVKSIEAYLYTSVKNRSINYLKSKYARIHFADLDTIKKTPLNYTTENDITTMEMKEAIHAAIHSLPSKCKIVFNLSRNAGLSNDEIAGKLNISKKTVQTQIGIAIKKIKEHLKDQWDNLPS